MTTDTGVAGDGITSDNTLLFTGTGEPGGTVTVLVNGNPVGTAVVDGAGNWTFDFSGTPLGDGSYTVTATVTDASGNTSPVSGGLSITVDTTAPAAPTVNNVTSTTTSPVLTGTATLGVGETLAVTVNGATYAVTTDAFGNWTLDLGTAVPTSGALGAFVDTFVYPVTATVSDLAGNTASAAGTVTIAVNDLPAVTVPGAQTVAEDAALPIGTISIADIDGNLVSAALTVANGTLTLTVSGAAVVAGNGTGAVTISGSQADINATLASLVYLGNANFNGADTLNITATDGAGATGTGIVAITVTSVNDTPTTTVPGAQSGVEDTPLAIAGVAVGDVDGNISSVRLTW